jgi:hypothetical protein
MQGGHVPLDVVVEGAAAVLVLAEEAEGVAVAEVLELEQHVIAELNHGGGDELLDELVVLRPSGTCVTHARVTRVVEEGLVVCADVEGDGEGVLGVDATEGSVKTELAEGDTHACRKEIRER